MNCSFKYFQILLFLLLSSFGLLASPSGFVHNSPAEAKLKASGLNQNILVYFSADWCLPCQLMEEHVLEEASIKSKLKDNYILISAEFDESKDKEWFDTYNVSCLPTMSIVNRDGEELDRIEGYVNSVELEMFLNNHILNQVQSAIAQSPEVKAKLNAAETLNRISNMMSLDEPSIVMEQKTQAISQKTETASIEQQDLVETTKVEKKNNPPTLIGIKDEVVIEKSSFYESKVSKNKVKSKVPPAVDLNNLATSPSRGSGDFDSSSKTVANSIVLNTEEEAKPVIEDTPLRTPITGKIISTTRSNVGIQFGAFGNYNNALNLIGQLEEESIKTIIIEESRGDKMLYKVMKLGVQSMFIAKKEIENYNRQGIKCFLKLL